MRRTKTQRIEKYLSRMEKARDKRDRSAWLRAEEKVVAIIVNNTRGSFPPAVRQGYLERYNKIDFPEERGR